MRVIGNRILVDPAAAEETRESGLVIPDAAREKPLRGKVLVVGPDSSISPEEVVLYSRYGGTDVEVNGNPLVVLREEDVLVVLPAADG